MNCLRVARAMIPMSLRYTATNVNLLLQLERGLTAGRSREGSAMFYGPRTSALVLLRVTESATTGESQTIHDSIHLLFIDSVCDDSRLDQGSDITIFQNQIFDNKILALPSVSNHHIQHCPGQVAGSNYLIRKQHSKHRIRRPQQSVGEVWFLSGLHGIDVCGPKEKNAWETGRD